MDQMSHCEPCMNLLVPEEKKQQLLIDTRKLTNLLINEENSLFVNMHTRVHLNTPKDTDVCIFNFNNIND